VSFCSRLFFSFEDDIFYPVYLPVFLLTHSNHVLCLFSHVFDISSKAASLDSERLITGNLEDSTPVVGKGGKTEIVGRGTARWRIVTPLRRAHNQCEENR
jgi:hypothetical protein